jgi:pectinesterase
VNKDAGIATGGSGGTSAPAESMSSSRSEGGSAVASSTGGSSQTSGSGGSRDAGLPDAAPVGGSGGRSASGGATGGSTTSSSAGSAASFTPCPGATQTLSVGSGQTYPTVQAAVNAVSSGNSKWVQINVKAGTYKEQVTINKPFVCLVGESATTTTISYTIDNNIVTGGTVLVKANDFSAANIAFENTHGKGESGGQNQAVALMAQGQRHQFRNCRFLSYQDTLYTNTGTQYFRDCFIQGSVDYIFGDATAVFEDCTMHNIAEGTAVTAPRTPQGTTYGFVFLGGSLTAASGVRANKVNLGRPWGPTAAAAFLNVKMDAHITSEGWTTMSDHTLAQTRFSEYKSTGAGASTSSSTRSSRQLSDAQAANYTVAKVLGSWTPGYSQ